MRRYLLWWVFLPLVGLGQTATGVPGPAGKPGSAGVSGAPGGTATAGLSVVDTYSVVMTRIVEDLQAAVNENGLAGTVGRQLAAQGGSGAWPDVNYDNPEFDHLARVKEFALAYSRKGGKYYGDATVYHGIVAGLQYWLDRDPHNRNWWFNEISYPQQIGQTLILMRGAAQGLPAALEARLIQRMVRKLKTGDFANTSDEALHYLYRACLTRNKATLDSAVTYLFEPVHLQSGGEGLQADDSYFQHGRQQAIASYGAVFVTNSYNAAWYLAGTPEAMPADQLKLLSMFFSNTFLASLRGTYFDFNTRGRGISRHDSMKAGVLPLLRKVALTDMASVALWQRAIVRASGGDAGYGVVPGHTCYWVGGYTLHNRPEYAFSVQLSSSRTLRTERGNNENLLGKFLPDGATDIRRRGGEYSNIMPVWAWDKLPGVTNREYNNDTGCTIRKEWGVPGTTVFSGGVNDGVYGATAYDLSYDSVTAHKSWFFFDKEVVCLGAGIKSVAPEAVTTTVNQCWQTGDVWAAEAGKIGDGHAGMKSKKIGDGVGKYTWVWQDSIGYFFPDGGEVHSSSRVQEGSWYRINRGQSKEGVSGKVFTLWMDHGVKPDGGGYAYIVFPGVNWPVDMTGYDISAVRIIENTAERQAVEHRGLDMLEVVFFAAGEVRDGELGLSVDKPCVVMIKGVHSSRPEVWVADPAQSATSLRVGLKMPGMPLERSVSVELPRAPYAGMSVKINFQK